MKTKEREYIISPIAHLLQENPLSNLSRERLEVYFNDLYQILILQIAMLPSKESLNSTEEARINWLMGQVLEVKKHMIHRFTESKN